MRLMAKDVLFDVYPREPAAVGEAGAEGNRVNEGAGVGEAGAAGRAFCVAMANDSAAAGWYCYSQTVTVPAGW